MHSWFVNDLFSILGMGEGVAHRVDIDSVSTGQPGLALLRLLFLKKQNNLVSPIGIINGLLQEVLIHVDIVHVTPVHNVLKKVVVHIHINLLHIDLVCVDIPCFSKSS